MIIHNVQEALVHYQTDNTDGCPKSLDRSGDAEVPDQGAARTTGASRSCFVCPASTTPTAPTSSSKGKDKQEGTADDIKSWEL